MLEGLIKNLLPEGFDLDATTRDLAEFLTNSKQLFSAFGKLREDIDLVLSNQQAIMKQLAIVHLQTGAGNDDRSDSNAGDDRNDHAGIDGGAGSGSGTAISRSIGDGDAS